MKNSELSPTASFDLVGTSLKGGLSVCFPKSRKSTYATAVAICRGASSYCEADVEGTLMHFAHFAPDPLNMSKALALLNLMGGYKGLLIYSKGRAQEWAKALIVLRCYSESAACPDRRAHCSISVHKMSITKSSEPLSSSLTVQITPNYAMAKAQGMDYLFPCRLLAFNFGFKLQAGHPSSEADQIQAGAVREGCDWCPSFNKQGG